MTRYLLNSAVITAPGTYAYRHVTASEAVVWMCAAPWESTIGYQETADAVRVIFGIEVPVNRRQITMQPGDQALVFRLTKRLDYPGHKGTIGVSEVLANSEIGLLTRRE